MPQVSATGAVVARDASEIFAALKRTRPIKFVAVVVLLAAVWGFARFGGPSPSDGVGPFSQPCLYTAAPGAGAAHSNVRAGPGAEFSVRKRLSRGAVVTGVARRADTQGDFWIELSDNSGFVKETVLAPSIGGARPQ